MACAAWSCLRNCLKNSKPSSPRSARSTSMRSNCQGRSDAPPVLVVCLTSGSVVFFRAGLPRPATSFRISDSVSQRGAARPCGHRSGNGAAFHDYATLMQIGLCSRRSRPARVARTHHSSEHPKSCYVTRLNRQTVGHVSSSSMKTERFLRSNGGTRRDFVATRVRRVRACPGLRFRLPRRLSMRRTANE
jgi:hypothetical protein